MGGSRARGPTLTGADGPQATAPRTQVSPRALELSPRAVQTSASQTAGLTRSDDVVRTTASAQGLSSPRRATGPDGAPTSSGGGGGEAAPNAAGVRAGLPTSAASIARKGPSSSAIGSNSPQMRRKASVATDSISSPKDPIMVELVNAIRDWSSLMWTSYLEQNMQRYGELKDRVFTLRSWHQRILNTSLPANVREAIKVRGYGEPLTRVCFV